MKNQKTYNYKLLFPNLEQTYVDPEEKYQLNFYFYIDSKKESVKECSFTFSGQMPNEIQNTCASLLEQVEGKGIQFILEQLPNFQKQQQLGPSTQMPFITVPFFLIISMLHEYLGKTLANNIKGYSPSNLICRCFAVDKSTIESFIEDNPEAGIKEVTIQLKAAGGCTSCKEDIAAIVKSQRLLTSPSTNEGLEKKITTLVELWHRQQLSLSPESNSIAKVSYQKEFHKIDISWKTAEKDKISELKKELIHFLHHCINDQQLAVTFLFV